jgi:hypothetical protein
MTPPWRFKMLTPTAARWLDDQVPALEELTGHPVRSRYKLPKDPDVWPPADVAVLAPATFNTINQWALGITEKIRRRIRGRGNRQGHPCDHHALRERRIRAAHPVPPEHCRLRAMGVHVLYGEGGFVPNEPGQGRPDAYPWHLTLAEAESVIGRRDAGRT